jgi:hypothetical protein
MIQAQTPEELPNPDKPQGDLISKVPGFATPVVQNTPESELDPEPPQNQTEEIVSDWRIFYHWWHRIALILLSLHGLNGLWDSMYFILFEYKELNYLLSIHQVNVESVNHLLSRAIISFVATFVNILFAIRLSKVKETAAQNIDLIVATFLIITTNLIQKFLVQLDLVNYVIELFYK